ncbi:MAG: hypothetical protein ACYSX0_07660 [Planctomycetota bacterium]|jgi:hypothetical protein
MNIEERLSRLERQLRWLKRLGALAIAGLRTTSLVGLPQQAGEVRGGHNVAVAASAYGVR